MSGPGESRPHAPAHRRARVFLYSAHLLTTWALGVSNTLLGVLLVAAPWLDALRVPPARAARRAAGFAGLYLLLLLASILASRDPAGSLEALSEIVSFGTFFVGLFWLRGERDVRRLVDLLILVGTVVALSGLAQVLLGYGGIDRRIRGPFSHYMTFAGTLLLVDLLLVARMLMRRGRAPGRGPTAWLDRPAVSWAALGAISLALLVSLTRSAWLALVAALIGLAAVTRPRLLLAVVPLAAALLVVAPVPLVHRMISITDVHDESNYDRVVMAEAGLRMVAERPLLGVGPDMVKRYWPIYRHPSAPRLVTPHLHNAYLQLAGERGLPALASYLALVACAAAAAWRGYRSGRAAGDGAADLHLGVLAALCGFSVAALFENNWGDTEVQRLVLFLLAVPFCLGASGEAREAG